MKQAGNCRHCGSPLYEGMKFCGHCGKAAEQVLTGQNRQPDRMQQPQRQIQQSDGMQQPRRQVQRSGGIQQPRRQVQRSGGIQQPRRERPEAGSTAYDPNTYENRVRRQRNRSGDEQSTNPGLRFHDAQSAYQDRQFYDECIVQQNQQTAQQKQRYRQEELERDWQQSWERGSVEDGDDERFTPLQYMLTGIAVILLMALVGFGVYWILGRSTGNTARRPEQNGISAENMQTDGIQAESLADIMILDGTQDKDTEADTQKMTEAIQSRTESESETESEIESETEEPQSETKVPREDTVHSYPEFALTIPGSWWGKYGIEQSGDSYTFYQQAAREAGYGGILFTISKYTDMSYETLPNYEVIGTGDGAALVYRLPNDLQYPKENAAVVVEYQAMANDVAGIRAGIQVFISGEGPHETGPVPEIQIFSEDYYVIEEPQAQQSAELAQPDYTGGYIPASSERALTDADVAGMSYDDLQMAINEIYARHGRIFQKESIASYFNSQSWYNGTVTADNFDESVFSQVESQNIQFLLDKMGN